MFITCDEGSGVLRVDAGVVGVDAAVLVEHKGSEANCRVLSSSVLRVGIGTLLLASLAHWISLTNTTN